MITSLHDVNQPEEEAPLPFRQALQELPLQWLKVITRPEAHTMTKEMRKANWAMICVQLFVLVVASGVGVFLVGLLDELFHVRIGVTTHLVFLPSLPGYTPSWLDLGLTPIEALLFTFITVSILHGLARLFGGQGNFRDFLYTSLLFLCPVLVISAMREYLSLGLGNEWFNVVGSGLLFAIKIFIAILQIFVLVAVHRLSYRSAVACVLILVCISMPLDLLITPLYILMGGNSMSEGFQILLALLQRSINLF